MIRKQLLNRTNGEVEEDTRERDALTGEITLALIRMLEILKYKYININHEIRTVVAGHYSLLQEIWAGEFSKISLQIYPDLVPETGTKIYHSHNDIILYGIVEPKMEKEDTVCVSPKQFRWKGR